MKTTHSSLLNCIAATFTTLMLTACGGSGGGGDVGTGSLSVSVTDAPVLEDVDVCIHFTGITLHHSDGDLIHIPYYPSTYTDATDCIDNVPSDALPPDDPANNAVNLSSLQGELSVSMMDSVDVKAGYYNWIRLNVDEGLSYVMDSEGQKNLSCPSCDGEQSGLKLNRGITVPAGGEADFMIDIDLAKSLNRRPDGDYKMRPTLRLIDMTEIGYIRGSVDSSLIPAMISGEDTGCKVYVYVGHDITPDDYHDLDNVLTSAKVLYDSESMYTYVAAYLQTDSSSDPTPYTVALTCDADDADINQNNVLPRLADDDVIFTDGVTDEIGQNADVFTDQSTIVNFPPEI